MLHRARAATIVDYDDLVGYGSEGLLKAVDTFDPTRGAQFSTWAVLRIRTTIQDALRTLDPLPRSLRTKGKAIDRVSYELANRTGQWPEATAVAAELGMPLATLRTTMQDLGTVVVSLDRVEDAHGEDGGYAWQSSVADDDPEVDPQVSLGNAETSLLLAEAMEHLPERERGVVTAYYRHGRSMRAIGDELGISGARVSQLNTRALTLLRTAITASIEGAPRIRRAA